MKEEDKPLPSSEGYDPWKRFPESVPEDGQWVIVRTEDLDKSFYFEDKWLGASNDFLQAVRSKVTHWTYKPKGCPCCGRL